MPLYDHYAVPPFGSQFGSFPSAVASVAIQVVRRFRSAVAAVGMATAADEAIGLVRRALLLRAKYRVQSEKLTIPLSILGVHPFNRAGVYPMEDTVVNLGLGILVSGLSVDEADHEGVCVQKVLSLIHI